MNAIYLSGQIDDIRSRYPEYLWFRLDTAETLSAAS